MTENSILFIGTSEFGLCALRELDKNFDVKLIVTQPDKINGRGNKIKFNAIKQYGIENGIEVFQPDNINDSNSYSFIKKNDYDYIVVVAYGQIIGKDIISLPKKNIVNIHASILPKYRGAAPIQRAIMNREKYTGISIMKVDRGLDTGDVYLTKAIEVSDKKYPKLESELAFLGASAIIEYIKSNDEEVVRGKHQDDKDSSYAKKVNKTDGYLDFCDVEKEIGKIYGLNPRPAASFLYDGMRVKVYDAKIVEKQKNPAFQVSEIIKVDDDGIFVNCNNGVMLITEIQFPNKKRMRVCDYIKGNTIKERVKLV